MMTGLHPQLIAPRKMWYYHILLLFVLSHLHNISATQETSFQAKTCCQYALTLKNLSFAQMLKSHFFGYKTWKLEDLEHWLSTPIINGGKQIAPQTFLERYCRNLVDVAGPCLVPLRPFASLSSRTFTPDGRYMLILDRSSQYIIDRTNNEVKATLPIGSSFIGIAVEPEVLFLSASKELSEGNYQVELYTFKYGRDPLSIKETKLIIEYEPAIILYLQGDNHIAIVQENRDDSKNIRVYKKNESGQFIELPQASIGRFEGYCSRTKVLFIREEEVPSDSATCNAITFDNYNEEWTKVASFKATDTLDSKPHGFSNNFLLLENGILDLSTQKYLLTKADNETLRYVLSPCQKATLIQSTKTQETGPHQISYTIFSAKDKCIFPAAEAVREAQENIHTIRPKLFCSESFYFHGIRTSYAFCPHAKKIYIIPNKNERMSRSSHFQFGLPNHDWCQLCMGKDVEDLKTQTLFPGYSTRNHEDAIGQYTTIKHMKKIRLYRIAHNTQLLLLATALANTTRVTTQALPHVTQLTRNCLQSLPTHDHQDFLNFLKQRAPGVEKALAQEKKKH